MCLPCSPNGRCPCWRDRLGPWCGHRAEKSQLTCILTLSPPFHLSLPLPPTSALEPLSLGIHTVKAERTLEPQGVLGRGLLPSAVLSGGYAGLGSLWGREGPSLQRDKDVGRERPGDSVVWGQGWQEWHWDHQGTATPRRPSGGARERTPGACAITLHSCSPSAEPSGKPEALEPVGAAPGSALLRGEQDGECGGKVVGAVQET